MRILCLYVSIYAFVCMISTALVPGTRRAAAPNAFVRTVNRTTAVESEIKENKGGRPKWRYTPKSSKTFLRGATTKENQSEIKAGRPACTFVFLAQ